MVVEIARAGGGGGGVVDMAEGARADPVGRRDVPGGRGGRGRAGAQEGEGTGRAAQQAPSADRGHGFLGRGQPTAGPEELLSQSHSDQVANPVCHLWYVPAWLVPKTSIRPSALVAAVTSVPPVPKVAHAL